MRTHPRHCKPGEQPCEQEHSYYCANCGDLFSVDGTDHFLASNGITLPNRYWPACSLRCYRQQYDNALDSNPNGLSWSHLGLKPSEGIDPNEPIDFQDLDDLQELDRIDLNHILDTNDLEEVEPNANAI